LKALTLGGDNTAIGDNALPILTGFNALTENNTAVGHQAGRYLAEGTDNTFVGFDAGSGTASHTGCNFNTCIGSGSGKSLTTGGNNIFLGYSAGKSITSANYNVAIGNEAMGCIPTSKTPTGEENVCIGYHSGRLFNNTTPKRNVGVGYATLGGGLGTTNDTTSEGNTCVGWNSGKNITNNGFNVGIGSGSLGGNGSATGGGNNVCVGENAGGLVSGSENVMVGQGSGLNVAAGSSNTIVGRNSGIGITTGTKNTCLGSDSNITGNPSNCCVIGNLATSSTSSSITLGRVGSDSVRLNKITPMYVTPSLASGDIGFIQSVATITYPGTTTNIIASNISANGTWVVYVFLNFTGLTNSPQLIVEDATPTTLGIVATRITGGTDRYSGSFPYTITAAANVVRIRFSVAPTTGGTNGGDANQYVRFVRIA
jgi:hypothetical protein